MIQVCVLMHLRLKRAALVWRSILKMFSTPPAMKIKLNVNSNWIYLLPDVALNLRSVMGILVRRIGLPRKRIIEVVCHAVNGF